MKQLLTVIILFILITVIFHTVNSHFKNNQRWNTLTGNHRRQPASVSNISHISEWMTFDYINHLFDIPASYLQEALQITDPEYPFMTIGQYSKKTHQDRNSVIQKIQDLIKLKLGSSSSQ
jgi:hypothetical protein